MGMRRCDEASRAWLTPSSCSEFAGAQHSGASAISSRSNSLSRGGVGTPSNKKKIDLGKRVLNFRLFRTKDQWEAATEYVQLRSYAKKRDEDHIARLERERIEAEKEAARKAEAARVQAAAAAEEQEDDSPAVVAPPPRKANATKGKAKSLAKGKGGKGAAEAEAAELDECAHCGTLQGVGAASFKRCSRCKLVR